MLNYIDLQVGTDEKLVNVYCRAKNGGRKKYTNQLNKVFRRSGKCVIRDMCVVYLSESNNSDAYSHIKYPYSYTLFNLKS